jgi:hypothetical protein
VLQRHTNLLNERFGPLGLCFRTEKYWKKKKVIDPKDKKKKKIKVSRILLVIDINEPHPSVDTSHGPSRPNEHFDHNLLSSQPVQDDSEPSATLLPL